MKGGWGGGVGGYGILEFCKPWGWGGLARFLGKMEDPHAAPACSALCLWCRRWWSAVKISERVKKVSRICLGCVYNMLNS